MPPNNRALVWAPESEQDLLDIWHYLAEAVGTDTADRQLRRIDEPAALFGKRPFAVARATSFDPDCDRS
jgi:plasmid stabilization system protein ParE